MTDALGAAGSALMIVVGIAFLFVGGRFLWDGFIGLMTHLFF
jgi:hypothetical protein